MSMTNYLENAILEMTLNSYSFPTPGTVYLSLHSTPNTEASAGTELSGNGYARQVISFGNASGGVIANDAAVTFTPSGGDWDRAVSAGIYDEETGGNMLYWYNIVPKQNKVGKTITFAIGDITVTLD